MTTKLVFSDNDVNEFFLHNVISKAHFSILYRLAIFAFNTTRLEHSLRSLFSIILSFPLTNLNGKVKNILEEKLFN